MRAQSAVEFLSTYAWAIMVVILAIGAVYYFGIIDPGSARYNECDLWPEFHCEDSIVRSDGTIQLQIRNNLQRLANVQVDLTTQDCTLDTATYVSSGVESSDFFNETGNRLITFSCTTGLVPGDLFRARIFVTYILDEQTVNHTIAGTLAREIE